MNYNVIRQAGLTNADVGRIVGVSRVAVLKYLSGESKPKDTVRGKAATRMEVLLTVLEKLVASGKLPKLDLAFVPRMPTELKQRRDAIMDKLSALVDAQVALRLANK